MLGLGGAAEYADGVAAGYGLLEVFGAGDVGEIVGVGIGGAVGAGVDDFVTTAGRGVLVRLSRSCRQRLIAN